MSDPFAPFWQVHGDLVFIPRRNVDKPAMVIELKYGSTGSPQADADAAIDQIRRKDYTSIASEYSGEVLLVGINYDKNGPEGKRHTCVIERITTPPHPSAIVPGQ